MKNKIDIFEILNTNINENQEQQNAPDFDFLNVRQLMNQLSRENEETYATEPGPEYGYCEPEEPEVEVDNGDCEPHEPEQELEPENEPEYDFSEIIERESENEPEPAPVKMKQEKRFRAPRFKMHMGPVRKLVVFAVIATLLLVFVVGFQNVSVNSMAPIISKGDIAVVNKMSSDFRNGDIIAIRSTDGRKLTARIVAVKGDMVSLGSIDGLYINNELQEEEYIQVETTATDPSVSYPVLVDEGEFFVLGDNRTDSIDSRDGRVGLVESKDIVGKVIFCFKIIK